MQRLLYFVRATWLTVVFVVLWAIAIRLYATSTPYTEARLVGMGNAVSMSIRASIRSVGEYFSLRHDNRLLAERVAFLENVIETQLGHDAALAPLDEGIFEQNKYFYKPLRVVSSTIARTRNYMVLDGGNLDGIYEGSGVLSADGYAVGYILRCNDSHSVVMPLLNTSIRLSVRLANDGCGGTLRWQGDDTAYCTMEEVSKYANIVDGERVVTMSSFFPGEVEVGRVEGAVLNAQQTMYSVRVRLSADFARLHNVVVVNNNMGDEARNMENE